MLVKIRTTKGGWALFDNAEHVEHQNNYEINNSAHLTSIAGNVDNFFKFLKDIEETFDEPIQVSYITFTSTSEQYAVVFNTVGYVCNDQGKTFDKVEVR